MNQTRVFQKELPRPENSDGIATVASKLVRERAVELDVINGRSAQERADTRTDDSVAAKIVTEVRREEVELKAEVSQSVLSNSANFCGNKQGPKRILLVDDFPFTLLAKPCPPKRFVETVRRMCHTNDPRFLKRNARAQPVARSAEPVIYYSAIEGPRHHQLNS